MNVIASRGQLRASLLRWALFTVPCVMLLGFLAGQFGSANTPWFRDLVKPEIFPPPATFGIVWTVLYAIMGFAVALVGSAWGASGRGVAIGLFVIHLALNLAWTPVFFGARNIEGALIVIGLVDITLIAVVIAFWRVRRAAGLLMLPYLAWVLFATVLNYEFLRANPESGSGAGEVSTQRIEI